MTFGTQPVNLYAVASARGDTNPAPPAAAQAAVENDLVQEEPAREIDWKQ